MITRLKRNIINYKTIISIFFSFILYFVFLYIGVISYNHVDTHIYIYVYSIVMLFMCWIISEIFIKKDFVYLFSLYILVIPSQLFVVYSSIFAININGFIISFNFLFLFLLLLKYLILSNNKIKIKFDLILLHFFLIIFSLISLFKVHYFHIAVNGIIYSFLIPLLLTTVLYNIINNNRDLLFILKSINFTLFIYNIITFLFSSLNQIFPMFLSSRVYGIYLNPNYFGFAQIISAATALFLIFTYERKNNFYKITFIISTFGIFYSGSRGAILSFFIVCLILFNLYIKSFGVKVILFNIIIILFGIFWLCGYNYFNLSNIPGVSRFLEKGLESGRYSIWANTIDYIANNNLVFWGIGLGNFLYTTSKEIGWVSAHNSFLHLSTTIGLIGSLLFHIFIFSRVHLFRILAEQNLYINFAGVTILGIFIYMNVVSFVPLHFFRFTPLEFGTMDMHFISYFLWIFIALGYKMERLKE